MPKWTLLWNDLKKILNIETYEKDIGKISKVHLLWIGANLNKRRSHLQVEMPLSKNLDSKAYMSSNRNICAS